MDKSYFPPRVNNSIEPVAFYLAELASQFARAYGPHREDLVMVEVDQSAMHLPDHRPALPGDPNSPVVPWTTWVSHRAIIGVHDLVPTVDGGYELARPWSPVYP